MNKHTPGPWRIVQRAVEEDGSVSPRHIVGADGVGHFVCPLEAQVVAEIATKKPGTFWDTTPTKEANARLIAAAPDSHMANVAMLAALDEAFDIKSIHGDEWIYDALPSSGIARAYFMARAAIAKATQP